MTIFLLCCLTQGLVTTYIRFTVWMLDREWRADGLDGALSDDDTLSDDDARVLFLCSFLPGISLYMLYTWAATLVGTTVRFFNR